jgi:hypothetical protein
MTEEEPDLLFWGKARRDLDKLQRVHTESMKLITGAWTAIIDSYRLLRAVDAAQWGSYQVGPLNREVKG